MWNRFSVSFDLFCYLLNRGGDNSFDFNDAYKTICTELESMNWSEEITSDKHIRANIISELMAESNIYDPWRFPTGERKQKEKLDLIQKKMNDRETRFLNCTDNFRDVSFSNSILANSVINFDSIGSGSSYGYHDLRFFLNFQKELFHNVHDICLSELFFLKFKNNFSSYPTMGGSHVIKGSNRYGGRDGGSSSIKLVLTNPDVAAQMREDGFDIYPAHLSLKLSRRML